MIGLTAERKARYDKFGDEGLKGGVPTADEQFLDGYVYHGDPRKTFKDFFGGANPFAGIYGARVNRVSNYDIQSCVTW